MFEKRKNYVYVAVVSVLNIILRGVSFVLPFASSLLVAEGFSIRRMLAVLVLLAFSFLINVIVTEIQKKVAVEFRCQLNMDLYRKLFKVRYSSLNRNGMPYYIERINLAVASYSDYFLYSIPNLISLFLTVGVSLLLICSVSIPIALVVLVILVIQLVGYNAINRKLKEKSIDLQKTCAFSFSNILSVLGCVDFIKAQACFDGIQKVLENDVTEIHKSNTNVNTYAKMIGNVLSLLISNMQYLVYLLFGFMVIEGNIPASEFLFAIMITNICFASFSELVRTNINLKDMKASEDFIEKELENEKEDNGVIRIESIDRISFSNCRIGYGENILIEKANIQINKGDVVLIKGKTGSGKSSLIKSLLGFLPVEGLSFNNVDINKIDICSVRSKIVLVPQNGLIFNGTVLQNVLFGEQTRDIDEVSKRSFFSKYVMSDGRISDMEITASGSNLSGGDKQKISVVRLFLKDPDLVILDEVTSSMDERTAESVYLEVLEKYKSRIIIIISHSPFVEKFATRVLKVENKRLVES